LFDQYKTKIRKSDGCLHLELWKDLDRPNIYFTYSHWESLEYLNQYRDSSTFKDVWPLTKKLFIAPAEVWTVQEKNEL
jgi:quinol monooxygenase YgiN